MKKDGSAKASLSRLQPPPSERKATLENSGIMLTDEAEREARSAIEGFNARPTPPPEPLEPRAKGTRRRNLGPTAKWPPAAGEDALSPPDLRSDSEAQPAPLPSRRKLTGEAWGQPSEDPGLSGVLRAVTENADDD